MKVVFPGFNAMAVLVVAMIATNSWADYDAGYDLLPPEQVRQAEESIAAEFADAKSSHSLSEMERRAILAKYSHLDPRREVRSHLLEEAVLFFDANMDKFPNRKYLSLVDLGLRSDQYRYFLVNLETGRVEKFRTTHGVGSDPEDSGWARSFGNVVDSGKSSLGFARTAEVYSGVFKRSIRLDGLSESNSKIRARAIVIHGWDGVKEEPVKQGRSRGCITLDWRVKDEVIDKIRGGSLIYTGR